VFGLPVRGLDVGAAHADVALGPRGAPAASVGGRTLGGDIRRGAATPVLTSWGILPSRPAGPHLLPRSYGAGAGLRDYANRTLHTAHAKDVAAASKLLPRVSVVFMRMFLIIPLGGPHAKALAPGRAPRSLPPRPDRQSRRSAARTPVFLSSFLTSFPPFGITVGTGPLREQNKPTRHSPSSGKSRPAVGVRGPSASRAAQPRVTGVVRRLSDAHSRHSARIV